MWYWVFPSFKILWLFHIKMWRISHKNFYHYPKSEIFTQSMMDLFFFFLFWLFLFFQHLSLGHYMQKQAASSLWKCVSHFMIRHQNLRFSFELPQLAFALTGWCHDKITSASQSRTWTEVCEIFFFSGSERDTIQASSSERLARKRTSVLRSLTVCWLFNMWIKGGKKT